MFFKYVQYWIYECFPSVGSAIVVEDYDEKKPRACHSKSGKVLSVSTYHKHLDRLRFDFVCWIPYGEHHAFREFEVISLFSGHIRWGPSIFIHRPERVIRKFGYVQTIPSHPVAPSICIEDIDDI